jgi:hypothetical protein
MSAVKASQWLDRLETACAKVSVTCLYLIIDQAGSNASLLPSVISVRPPMRWYSLFTGLPEEGLEDIAPLLVQVDLAQPLQRQWLIGLMHHLHRSSQLLALVSHWPFLTLAQHLSRCLNARNGGCRGLLRYYDPRLFPLLFSHVLEPEQQQAWLRPVEFWSWLDLDGSPRLLAGKSESPECADTFNLIELSDSQLGTLRCASDATLFIGEFGPELPSDWTAEKRFQTCYAAMLEATQRGLLSDDDREAFTFDVVRNA